MGYLLQGDTFNAVIEFCTRCCPRSKVKEFLAKGSPWIKQGDPGVGSAHFFSGVPIVAQQVKDLT